MASEQDSGTVNNVEQQSEQAQPSARLKRNAGETDIYSVDAAGVDVNSLMQAKKEDGRGDVTAATVARMMGVATASELKLVEGKIDLLATKLAGFGVRLEKMLTILNRAPTGADLERIDVQIGSLKALIKDSLTAFAGEAGQARPSRSEHKAEAKHSEVKPETSPPGSAVKEAGDK